MQLYWPKPTPPGQPNDCFGCAIEIDGIDVDGFWLERECWQAPNRHELYCLACCVDKMNDWANQADVVDEADVKAQLS